MCCFLSSVNMLIQNSYLIKNALFGLIISKNLRAFVLVSKGK